MQGYEKGEKVISGESASAWSAWDLIIAGMGVGALALSQDERIGGTLQVLLSAMGQGGVEYPFLKLLLMGPERRKAKEGRMWSGHQPIKRRGEQIIVLGGEGNGTVDELFKTSPKNIVPILHTSIAAESMKDYFRAGTFGRLYPFYVNLGVEGHAGTTVISSPEIDVLKLTPKNLIKTVGGDKLITVSVGDPIPSSFHTSLGKGISDEESIILQQRLTQKMITEGLINSPEEVTNIRISKMYEILDKRKARKSIYTPRSAIKTDENENRMFSGGNICVDAWAVVMYEIANLIRLNGTSMRATQIGIMADTDTLNIESLPYTEVFGFASLGNVANDASLSLLRDFYEKDRESKVVFEVVVSSDDLTTLAKVKAKKELPDDDLAPLRDSRYIYVFHTPHAADMAIEAGAENVICIARLQAQLVNIIVDSLKTGIVPDKVFEEKRPQGESIVVSIQQWLDELLLHREIVKSIDRPRELEIKKGIEIREQMRLLRESRAARIDEVMPDEFWWSLLSSENT